MITESKVTEIFCIADDFCKEFEGEMAKMHFLPQLTLQNGKKAHDVGCRGHHDSDLFPLQFVPKLQALLSGMCAHSLEASVSQTFSYNRFVEVMPRCFVAMTMFLRLACFGECTGISFVDSTCIPVIHNKRRFSMKVFRILPKEEYDGMVCRLQTASAM